MTNVNVVKKNKEDYWKRHIFGKCIAKIDWKVFLKMI